MLTESLHHVFVGRATTGGLGHVITKQSPRGINPAVVLSALVLSMAGTSTFNATATPIALSNAIESLPAHQSADGYLLPAWPRSSASGATVI